MHAFIVLGGDRGQRCGGQIQYDPTLLPRHFYQQLQKDHWCRFPRKAAQVRDLYFHIIWSKRFFLDRRKLGLLSEPIK